VECLVAVLVDATTEHPFPITVTVPVKTAAKSLGNISDHLDRLGLVPSVEWSLNADVEEQKVHLRFALHSQEAADRLKALLVDTASDESSNPQSEDDQVGFGIGGPASARFLDVFRIPKSATMQPLEFHDLSDL